MRWIFRIALVVWIGWWGLILANPEYPLGLSRLSNQAGAMIFALLSIVLVCGSLWALVRRWRRMGLPGGGYALKTSRRRLLAAIAAVAMLPLVLGVFLCAVGVQWFDVQETDFAQIDAIAPEACAGSGDLAGCDGRVVSVHGDLRGRDGTFVVDGEGMAFALLDESYVIDPRCVGQPVQVVGLYSVEAGGITLIRSTLVLDYEDQRLSRCRAL